MGKQLLTVLAIFTFTLLSPSLASAQFPRDLKIPKVGKPKPTPAETAQPAPSGETQPAAQPGAHAATNPAPPEASPRPQAGGITLSKTLIRFCL